MYIWQLTPSLIALLLSNISLVAKLCKNSTKITHFLQIFNENKRGNSTSRLTYTRGEVVLIGLVLVDGGVATALAKEGLQADQEAHVHHQQGDHPGHQYYNDLTTDYTITIPE